MGKEKKTDKASGAKKTADELRELHAVRIESCVRNVAKWSAKLTKNMKSRKYPASEAQIEQVMDQYDKVHQAFVESLTTPPKADDGFTLIR